MTAKVEGRLLLLLLSKKNSIAPTLTFKIPTKNVFSSACELLMLSFWDRVHFLECHMRLELKTQAQLNRRAVRQTELLNLLPFSSFNGVYSETIWRL